MIKILIMHTIRSSLTTQRCRIRWYNVYATDWIPDELIIGVRNMWISKYIVTKQYSILLTKVQNELSSYLFSLILQ